MFFAKLHPFFVHFPVGLLVSGVVFEFYGKLQKEPTAVEAGRFNIRFGFWWALATVCVGLAGLLGLEVKEKFRAFLGLHFSFALSTLLVFGTAVAVLRWFKGRIWAMPLYFTLITLGLFCVLATGYCGGELVHRFGVATAHPLE